MWKLSPFCEGGVFSSWSKYLTIPLRTFTVSLLGYPGKQKLMQSQCDFTGKPCNKSVSFKKSKLFCFCGRKTFKMS